MLVLFGVCWASGICGLKFLIKFGNILAIISLNFSSASFFLSLYTDVNLLHIVLHVTEVMFFFFYRYFNLDNVHWSVFKFSDSFVHNVQSAKKCWSLPGILFIKAPWSFCSLAALWENMIFILSTFLLLLRYQQFLVSFYILALWHFFYPYWCHLKLSLTLYKMLLFSHSVMSASLGPHGLQHARLPSHSITISWSLLKLMSVESMMPSNHLVLCCPLLLLPSVFPSTRVFSNESGLWIRWVTYWSFSCSMSPSNEYSGLISFRIDWFALLAV